MSGFTTSARVVYVVLLGVTLGATLFLLLVLHPSALVHLPSEQSATELVRSMAASLDFFVLIGSPLLLICLLAGFLSSGYSLRLPLIVLLLLAGAASISHFWLEPEMLDIRQSLGQPIQYLEINNPLRLRYTNFTTLSNWLHWFRVFASLYLLGQGVVSASPKRSLGLRF